MSDLLEHNEMLPQNLMWAHAGAADGWRDSNKPSFVTQQENTYGFLDSLFDGGKAEEKREQATREEVRKKFPYPPKSCAQARLMAEAIRASIEQHQRTRAANGCDKSCRRVNDRYIVAYEEHLGTFNSWIVKAECDKIELEAENQKAIQAQLEVAQEVDRQIKAEAGAAGGYGWIYFGVAAMVIITTTAMIVKAKKEGKV